jgi:ribosomal protein L31E
MMKEVKIKTLMNLNMKMIVTMKEKKRAKKAVVMVTMTVVSPFVEEMKQ